MIYTRIYLKLIMRSNVKCMIV